jgi:hypothetical protein
MQNIITQAISYLDRAQLKPLAHVARDLADICATTKYCANTVPIVLMLKTMVMYKNAPLRVNISACAASSARCNPFGIGCDASAAQDPSTMNKLDGAMNRFARALSRSSLTMLNGCDQTFDNDVDARSSGVSCSGIICADDVEPLSVISRMSRVLCAACIYDDLELACYAFRELMKCQNDDQVCGTQISISPGCSMSIESYFIATATSLALRAACPQVCDHEKRDIMIVTDSRALSQQPRIATWTRNMTSSAHVFEFLFRRFRVNTQTIDTRATLHRLVASAIIGANNVPMWRAFLKLISPRLPSEAESAHDWAHKLLATPIDLSEAYIGDEMANLLRGTKIINYTERPSHCSRAIMRENDPVFKRSRFHDMLMSSFPTTEGRSDDTMRSIEPYHALFDAISMRDDDSEVASENIMTCVELAVVRSRFDFVDELLGRGKYTLRYVISHITGWFLDERVAILKYAISRMTTSEASPTDKLRVAQGIRLCMCTEDWDVNALRANKHPIKEFFANDPSLMSLAENQPLCVKTVDQYNLCMELGIALCWDDIAPLCARNDIPAEKLASIRATLGATADEMTVDRVVLIATRLCYDLPSAGVRETIRANMRKGSFVTAISHAGNEEAPTTLPIRRRRLNIVRAISDSSGRCAFEVSGR